MTVHIDAHGEVWVSTGKVEIGQGLHHALSQIVADALDCPIERVHLLPVDTDHSPDQGVTSGSRSLQEAGEALRRACLALRPDGGRQQHVGRALPRPWLDAIFAGAPVFIHDLVLADMQHGRVLHPPWTGRWVELPPLPAGVVRDGQLLGVLGERLAEVDAIAERLRTELRAEVPPGLPDEAADLQRLPAAMRVVQAHGEAPGDGHDRSRTLRARYTRPWLAHASIGPSCALAQWSPDGGLHVWSHSQGIFHLRRDLAQAFGLPAERVRVTHVPGAGCYGHNGADDVAYDAAWLARQAGGRPVRVVWSRADELSHAPFGPAMVVELAATLDADGRVRHWQHDVWSPGHSRRPGRAATPALLGAWQVAEPAPMLPSIDMPMASGGAERNAIPGYALPALQVRCHTVSSTRRSSALRGLGAVANVFAIESFVDEIAHATGADPWVLRRSMLTHDPRAIAVLDTLADRAERLRRQRREGEGFGVAQARYKGDGAWCAVLAEVEAGERLRVRRLTLAVDVGLAVNPDGVRAQIEGGAIQATSWALLEAARPSHAGWAEYPILRFSEVPEVDVILMPGEGPSLGAGEAAVGPTVAAIANALFDALGVRVRDLPLTPERIIAAMDDSKP